MMACASTVSYLTSLEVLMCAGRNSSLWTCRQKEVRLVFLDAFLWNSGSCFCSCWCRIVASNLFWVLVYNAGPRTMVKNTD